MANYLITIPYQQEILLRRIHQSTDFQTNEILSHQRLNSFQLRMMQALKKVAEALLKGVDWVVIDSQDSASITKPDETFLDAVFTQDNMGTGDADDDDFFSHGHSARTTASTPLFPAADDFTFALTDRIYFSHKWPYDGLDFNFDTVASPSIFSAGDTFEYWDGTSWTDIVATDGTSGFTTDGLVTWTIPSDWVKDSLDDILSLSSFSIDTKDRFWTRVTRTQAGNQFRIDTATRRRNWQDPLEVTNPSGDFVEVAPGVAVVNGQIVVIEDYQLLDLSDSKPSSDSRITAVQLQDDGTISALDGDVAASPISPDPRLDAIKLADVTLNSGGITGIADARLLYDLDFSWAC
jgi:hypothetical protein